MSFFNSSSVLVCILLATFTTMIDVKATKLDLNKICSNTQHPSFCIQTLNSDPRTATADLHGLSDISIDLAKAAAKNTSHLLRNLIVETNGFYVQRLYEECSKYYGAAMTDFERAKWDLAFGDYQRLESSAGDAADQVENCKDQLEVVPLHPDINTLVEKNGDDIDMSYIVYAIATLLSRSY